MNIIFLSLIIYSYEKFTFVFKTSNQNGTFYVRNMDNIMITNIEVGDPKVTIPFEIKIRQYPLLLTDVLSNVRKDIPLYNPSKSHSFTENEWAGAVEFKFEEYFRIVFIAQEDFIFSEEKINGHQLNFFLVREAKKNYSGILGLSIYKNENYNKYGFMTQIKKNKLIQKQMFYFNFEENKIIFGEYPHIISPKKYLEKNYCSVKAYFESNEQNYDILFDNVTFIKNGYNEIDQVVELNIESGLFKGNSNFGKYLSENYFVKFSDCEKVTIMDKYYSYVCLKKNAMDKFEDITFNLKDEKMAFYLTKKDLFKEEEGKYYFLMYFNEKEDLRWSFGKNFFVNNMIVFDVDKKEIGHYFQQKTNHYNTGWFIVIIIILIIFVVVLGGLLYYHIINKPRKKRANELEDNYEYYSSINEDNKTSLT